MVFFGTFLFTKKESYSCRGHETPQLAPAGATPVRCRPRFPSRNRRFPDRCRSADCASTAFRCRCLLLRQKLFVLPCRRLRNNYILCPTGTPTFAALRRQRRDLIIATRPAHQPLPSLYQRQRQGLFRAPARATFVCGDKSSQKHRQKLRFCTSSARYTALVCKAAPPRNRHFLTRCRSADCASTAFRCRCLLLW